MKDDEVIDLLNKTNLISEKVVLYLRCSTKRQNNERLNNMSLTTQEGICKEYCSKMGKSVGAIYSEIVSGRHCAKQKVLQQMFDKEVACTIVVADASRFTRDFYGAMELFKRCDEKNIKLISAREDLDTSSLFGRRQFIDNLYLAKLESDLISLRVQSSIDYRKKRGIFSSRTKFGYQLVKRHASDGKYQIKSQIHYEEQLVTQIVHMLYYGCENTKDIINILKHLQPCNENCGRSLIELKWNSSTKCTEEVPIDSIEYGNFTYDDVAHILNVENVKKRGKPLTKSSVLRLLKRKRS